MVLTDGHQIFRNKILSLALNVLKRNIWLRNNYDLDSNFFLGCYFGIRCTILFVATQTFNIKLHLNT